MASEPRVLGAGVEVVLENLTRTDRPLCPHGPAILFERFVNSSTKRFFACSSCRDRKVCSFYQNEDDVVSETTAATRKGVIDRYRAGLLNKKDFKRLASAHAQSATDRRFCRTCHVLLLPGEAGKHHDHKILNGVTDKQLQRPTLLLSPLENNKSNAQFLFSEKTKDFLVETIDTLGYTHVLCIGVPRIHEALSKQRSFLLDIDSRFYQFYAPSVFAHYNMFNQYFFAEDGVAAGEYAGFLQEAAPGKLLILIDPPFGGLVDLLSHTLNSIKDDFIKAHPDTEGTSVTPDVFWFFPYFMQPRLCEKWSDFGMLDYKVDYSNHETFQEGSKGRKYGSPVRIFTNVSLASVTLPKDEGYKFCQDCQKYVSKENQHCKICKDCPSKDGKTYVHCDVCERCVKPSRVHCFKCEMCLMPDHTCGCKLGAGCHICGDFTHKRRDCPTKNKPVPAISKKRKGTTEPAAAPPKKEVPRNQTAPMDRPPPRPGRFYKNKKGKKKTKSRKA